MTEWQKSWDNQGMGKRATRRLKGRLKRLRSKQNRRASEQRPLTGWHLYFK